MKIADLHCDTISRITRDGENLLENEGHFDIKRALAAGIRCQFMAMFTEHVFGSDSLRKILLQTETFHRQMDIYKQYVYPLTVYAQLESEENQDKIGCLLHLEGAEALGVEPEILWLLYRLGLRSLGLTWNHRNLLADGSYESPDSGGLSHYGRKILDICNDLGVIVDLAHLNKKSFYQVLERSTKPVVVSHANVYSLCSHFRNLDDDQIMALADHEGVIGVNLVADFVSSKNPRLQDYLRHITYIADLVGIEHVALGSDFDGADNLVLHGVEGYGGLGRELNRIGFNWDEINMIAYDNIRGIIKAII